MCGHTPTHGKTEMIGRLKSRTDFLAVRKGERRKGPFFLLEVLKRSEASEPRVGYTVTKRQGNAVERNRMRRRLREAVRLHCRFAMRPGHDYVIVARRDTLDASFSRLTAALRDRIEGSKDVSGSVSGQKAGRKQRRPGKSGPDGNPLGKDRPDKSRSKPDRPSGMNDGK